MFFFPDHSVHTTRLWAMTETKKLANNWNVESFFLITHCDIVNCLSQLSDLRTADHTLEIEKGGLGVHVQVCANMRAKLISEVKTNIEKLKVANLFNKNFILIFKYLHFRKRQRNAWIVWLRFVVQSV